MKEKKLNFHEIIREIENLEATESNKEIAIIIINEIFKKEGNGFKELHDSSKGEDL